MAFCCFRFLNAPLDIADGFQIFGQLAAVAVPELGLQPVDAARHVIENAAAAPACAARRAAGSVLSPSPNSRSNTARGLTSIGIGVVGRAPGDRVGVGAAITGIAAARQARRFQADFERGKLRLLAQLLARQSDRPKCRRECPRLRSSSDARRSARWRPRARDRRAPSPSARPLICARPLSTSMLLAERLQRLHGRREFEARAFAGAAVQLVQDDAVRHVDEAHARRPASRRQRVPRTPEPWNPAAAAPAWCRDRAETCGGAGAFLVMIIDSGVLLI